MGDIELNYSTANKFLKSSGLKASEAGTEALRKGLATLATQIAAEAAKLATADGKKTIMPEYVESILTKVKIE